MTKDPIPPSYGYVPKSGQNGYWGQRSESEQRSKQGQPPKQGQNGYTQTESRSDRLTPPLRGLIVGPLSEIRRIIDESDPKAILRDLSPFAPPMRPDWSEEMLNSTDRSPASRGSDDKRIPKGHAADDKDDNTPERYPYFAPPPSSDPPTSGESCSDTVPPSQWGDGGDGLYPPGCGEVRDFGVSHGTWRRKYRFRRPESPKDIAEEEREVRSMAQSPNNDERLVAAAVARVRRRYAESALERCQIPEKDFETADELIDYMVEYELTDEERETMEEDIEQEKRQVRGECEADNAG